MTNPRLQFLTTAMIAALLTACGGGDSTGPGTGGAFTATVAGSAWQSDAISLQTTSGGSVTPGSLIISGNQVGSGGSYRSISLLLGFITGPGTYPLGVNLGTTGGGAGTVLVWNGSTSSLYSTPFNGDAGTVQITSVGSNVVGTFSYVAPPLTGGGASQTVTNGAFDVPVPANFVAATTAGRGSTFSATVGGVPFNGATVLGVGTPSSFSLSVSTDAYSIVTTPLTVVTTGTYTVGAQVQILVSQATTTNGWGSGGGTGSVTFSAVGARVIGTMSATLAPVGSTVGSLTITGGTFDVRLP